MKLKEFTSVITDYVSNGSFKSLRDNAYYVSEDRGFARVIRLTDYNNNFNNNDTVWVDEHGYKFLNKSALKYGDIIVSNVGTYLGTVFRTPQLSIPMTLGPNAILIRANNSILNNYLYYLLSSQYGYAKLMAIKSGSAMPKFNKTDLKEIDFNIHTLEEQQHIVDILGSIDDKIENLETINTKLQEYSLKKYRLCFSNVATIPLSDIASVTMGQSPYGNTLNEKLGTIFYQGRTDFGFRYPSVRLYTTEPKRMAKVNDILLSVRAPVGDINMAFEECCIGRGIAAITSQYKSFIYYSLLNQKSDFDIYNNSGTIFGSINRDALLSFKIPAADLSLVQDFEKIVCDLDNKILINTLEIDKLTELKQAFLQKFFG